MSASPQLQAALARKPAPDPELVNGYLTGEIATQKAAARPGLSKPAHRLVTRRRYKRSPDRQKSIERRRTLAATWPMPPSMCGKLTTSQCAYAKIIADEFAASGDCRRTLDEIAARAGMCSKTAQRAQDRLKELGWIMVEVRPGETGRKNLPNIVRLVSPEWLMWIKMGPTWRKPRPGIAGHSCVSKKQEGPSTVNHSTLYASAERAVRPQGAVRGVPWSSS